MFFASLCLLPQEQLVAAACLQREEVTGSDRARKLAGYARKDPEGSSVKL